MTPLLRWALINAVFGVALIALLVEWGGVPLIAKLAIALVLFVYALGALDLFRVARNGGGEATLAKLATASCPAVAMLGTVGGFRIAFSADVSNVQQRVLGASAALTATFVGISCMLALMWLRYVVERR